MFIKWGHMYRGVFWPLERKNERSSVPILGWRRNHWRRLFRRWYSINRPLSAPRKRVNWRSGMAEATVQCHGHKDSQPSYTGVIVYMGLKIRKWQDNCINDLLWWFTKMIYNDDLWRCFKRMIYDDFYYYMIYYLFTKTVFENWEQGVKLFMVVNFTCWAPFGLIQFYFLFSGRELAGIGGRNGGRDNY